MNNKTYHISTWEKIVVYLIATSIVGLALWLIMRNEPFSDPNLISILRIILSLAMGILGIAIPGFIHVDWHIKGLLVRASGGAGLFVLTFIYTPSVLSNQSLTSRRAIELQRANDVAYSYLKFTENNDLKGINSLRSKKSQIFYFGPVPERLNMSYIIEASRISQNLQEAFFNGIVKENSQPIHNFTLRAVKDMEKNIWIVVDLWDEEPLSQ